MKDGRPLVAFYGDDFTGSSAVMEVLEFAGVPTTLFLAPPSAAELAALRERGQSGAAIGIAGLARSRDPAWMDANLPEVFRALDGLGAHVTHYKVCSTFDSSPEVGSIGRAIDIAAPILGGRWHPLVVGCPELRRYQVFGTLFAGTDDGVYRLDRYPVMRRHPVTPMDEADLGRHLARQTDRAIGLVDLAQMKAGQAKGALDRNLEEGAEIIALDAMDDETMREAGRLIWEARRGKVFAVGSQGVEYALVAYWRETGLLGPASPAPFPKPAKQIFAVSGSCSAITSAQIRHAQSNGFAVLDLEASLAVDQKAWNAHLDMAHAQILSELSSGQSVIAATARGPDDPALARVADATEASGQSKAEVNERISVGLGRLARNVVQATKLTRIVVAGGDTSGHAMVQMGVRSISAIAQVTAGAPLCRVQAPDGPLDGLEVVLKGGQMGGRDLFSLVRDGRQAAQSLPA
ncbi:four-carbon acid sugar kinase family protein [Frigidibacter sp. ROC022]|uniref:four-carbon acid sugar kinase family protein n=1 Tax=Frigidibacter sp. ROC022 TaxID=2971796 RepID=UPI00215AB156|nr:four-carbon acid sugar kinase family protein [Frigidibacter sp. ROC022]MCR8722778.1 four-carbon acid sugar kinase family protein [Frigidibacter sp. ROC022]